MQKFNHRGDKNIIKKSTNFLNTSRTGETRYHRDGIHLCGPRHK